MIVNLRISRVKKRVNFRNHEMKWAHMPGCESSIIQGGCSPRVCASSLLARSTKSGPSPRYTGSGVCRIMFLNGY